MWKTRRRYLFSQYLSREGCINVIIADNGMTVYGSYVKTGRHMDDIGTNEAEALKMANQAAMATDEKSRGTDHNKTLQITIPNIPIRM